jgi:hypothetical protein
VSRAFASLTIVVLAGVWLAAQRTAPPSSLPADPATDLVRARLFLTTTASAVDFSVDGDLLANAVFTLETGPASLRATIDGSTIHITGNTLGQMADLQIDMILAAVVPHGRVGWLLAPVSGDAQLSVQNLNSVTPVTIDQFRTDGPTAHFTSSSDLLRAGGPLAAVPAVNSHLVLAFFYPWYDLNSWSNSQLLDHPLQPYSTDDLGDLTRIMTQAKAAGLDALVVSWQGKDVGGGWNHRRMLLCLQAAHVAGLQIATLLESTVANPLHQDALADPDTILSWLTDVVDDYASQPAYLRVNGRPVVLAYAAQRLSRAGWADALFRLRAGGRDVLLVGEGINATRLGALDGLFFYASNLYQGDEILGFDRVQSLSARTYDRLPNDSGIRRVWVATVSPGYDDTRLTDGRVPRVTDRAAGLYYDHQWQSAIDMRADWIVVTSWNEWGENTQIEPSQRYGDLYLTLTKDWAARFRRLHAVTRP